MVSSICSTKWNDCRSSARSRCSRSSWARHAAIRLSPENRPEKEKAQMAELAPNDVLTKLRKGEKLERADLKGIQLPKAVLEGASLRRCELDGANLEGAKLRRANLKNASLR